MFIFDFVRVRTAPESTYPNLTPEIEVRTWSVKWKQCWFLTCKRFKITLHRWHYIEVARRGYT